MADGETRLSSSHLSIGEVLGLLLEEFPDVTISKIRFLESQGLIEPERTPSGYRKFYEVDVELLRCILREQKDNFLPLRVIKDRLDSGEIDPTNEIQQPAGIANVRDDTPPGGNLADSRSEHPSGRSPSVSNSAAEFFAPAEEPTEKNPDDTGAIELTPGVVLDAHEVCSMSGLTPEELDELRSYGVVQTGPNSTFDEDALEVARVSKKFLELGVDARHLRGWRVAADREAGLYEQIIQPYLRQRNPLAHEQAHAQLAELEHYGEQLRSAMMRTLLRRHLDR
jgi:DNA-binding transcriptional MerR regulator